MTITEFLLARIAEDEAFVEKAIKSYQHVFGIPHYFDPNPGREFQSPMVGMSPYAARAECAAKRAIVEAHSAWDSESGATYSPDYWQAPMDYVIAALAAVYVNHEDYDQAWAL